MPARSSYEPVKIYLFPAEKDAIRSAADAAGLSMGSWLRLIALEAARKKNAENREPSPNSVDK